MRKLNRTFQKLVTKSEIDHYNGDYWYWEYDNELEWDFDDDDFYPEYTYLDREEEKQYLETILLGPKFRRRQYSYTPYRVIDLNSIYSKQEKRNRVIDELLGIKVSTFTKPTFSDIFKK